MGFHKQLKNSPGAGGGGVCLPWARENGSVTMDFISAPPVKIKHTDDGQAGAAGGCRQGELGKAHCLGGRL